MTRNETLKVLEALASGCSPTTGEMLELESVLHERSVIRALQIAIEAVKKDTAVSEATVLIDSEEVLTAMHLFEGVQQKPTANRLIGFFLASRNFRNHQITEHPLYGKYQHRYQKGQLLDFLNEFFETNGFSKSGSKRSEREELEFFQGEIFNRLSESALVQLKEKVNALGVWKTEGLTEYILSIRKTYPRAYESWSSEEKRLLERALQYTNDLELLSHCFQRGKGSINAMAAQLLPTTDARRSTENSPEF